MSARRGKNSTAPSKIYHL